ncbi:MAG: hypothetical protein VR64_23415 [Desulfatitalea sp. BRH_c12]|nr:MAG: hypothetical protein VR64_23415 [Desulfatitalea sp. BRH_c12]
MRKWTFSVFVLFCIALPQNSAYAALIGTDLGYHEIIFYGTISNFDGNFGLPTVDSLSPYTPVIGDPVSIHFGASLYDIDWMDIKCWNPEWDLDVFQMSISENIIDVTRAFDFIENSSFRPNFSAPIILESAAFAVNPIGWLYYNFDSLRGSFYMAGEDFECFTELASAQIIAEPGSSTAPVPEASTIILVSAGLLVIVAFRKRNG